MRITYFVHSTTADNIHKVASGWNDIPLSEVGLAQAHELKQQIAHREFHAVYASDLLRARQTAEIVFGSAARYDARLRECNYGAHNGGPAAYVDEFVRHNSSTETFSAGESLLQVELRVRTLLAELVQWHEGHNVAFVSHRFPQLALEVITRQISWEQALQHDWRANGEWQPGWEYDLTPVLSHLVDARPGH